MKKVLLTILFCGVLSTSDSQSKVGIFAGVNAAAFSDGFLENVGIHSNSFSFHIGGFYEYRLSKKIAFRPKLVYSQQGDREEFYRSIEYVVSYLNLPLNFKFFNKPYVLFGPQIGYLLNTEKKELDFGDLKTIDYGLNLGIGIDIKNFFIELNLYQGINELIEVKYEQNNPTKDIDIKATNALIQLSLGYNFDL